jgi:hypothetical protein
MASSSVSQMAFVSTIPISPADWCGPAIDALELVALNTAPAAVAVGPCLVAAGREVVFDGSGSSDPDGDSLIESWSANGGTVDGNVYTAGNKAGIFDVCLTMNDGSVDSEPDCTMVVVYESSGGWIDSPAGAYKDDESLSGKATFGFIAKYKKGATVPDGNTQFQFKAGDLNFHSTSYEWLVVADNTAQFKGEGTINGEGSYRFMIWADDENPDTFRIQISGDNGAFTTTVLNSLWAATVSRFTSKINEQGAPLRTALPVMITLVCRGNGIPAKITKGIIHLQAVDPKEYLFVLHGFFHLGTI